MLIDDTRGRSARLVGRQCPALPIVEELVQLRGIVVASVPLEMYAESGSSSGIDQHHDLFILQPLRTRGFYSRWRLGQQGPPERRVDSGLELSIVALFGGA
ncbi:hypothetical protein [Naumannella halotolerans]|uniref:hypothetical protein n=1 Tax=Naumannella halotolerans TaxID=993414 RepID=UPI00105C9BEF|nr:hypothetical protein [Naumannella halotolerans]